MTTLWMLISSIFASFVGLAVYIYYLNKGQFDDPEEVKYQIFYEENSDN